MYKINHLVIPNKIKFIGEIGINHNGSLNLAKKLIKKAKEIGCDYVKFQKRTVNKVYSEKYLNQKRISPWGKTQKEQKEGLELNYEEYRSIHKYCSKIGMKWFASAWDDESLEFLKKFNLDYNKIASPLITNLDLIEKIAKQKKHTLISTGMSKYKDIDKVVKIFREKKCKFTILHCVSEYPCEEKNINLINMIYLKKRYKCKIGYSGHESSLTPSVIAAMLGAEVIERHITLDRKMYGSDQASSLSVDGFKRMIVMVKKINKVLGKKKDFITKNERINAKKLRYWI